jgi:hypothetical protein
MRKGIGTFSYNSSFLNNSVQIIDGLRSDELQTATHLKDGLSDLNYEMETPYCQYHKVESRANFIVTLGEIRQQCALGLKPIIHIEAHGDNELGLSISDARELVSWTALCHSLRAINILTKNNTGVVMAACHGLYAIKPLTIHDPAPFYFLIGSEGEITAGELDSQMKKFYMSLFATSSLSVAMNEVDKRFQQFHAERFVCIALGRLLKSGCMGHGAKARVERYVTEAVKSGAPVNRESLRKIRKKAKKAVKPSRGLFERYARPFLHGRCNIYYGDFLAFLRGGLTRE